VNARHLTVNHIPEPVDMVVCDASFISLTKVLPASLGLVKSGGMLAALIKPQFEVGKGQVGKGGVVRDPELHQAVQDDIAAWLANDMGWQVHGITESSITGPEGNREFIIAARKP
jgi:23S rRNA (cytidine1920-2'-O)/16S rRNA (cytidine1409-2'-O)-methyltransferase